MNKRQPVGIKDMCMYLCKFLKDESRYGDISNKNKRLYKIANQYINQENDKAIYRCQFIKARKRYHK